MRALAITIVVATACRIPTYDYTGEDDAAANNDATCWSLTPSNFNPCSGFPPAGSDVVITRVETLDTDTGMIADTATGTNSLFGAVYTTPSGRTVLLAHVESFTLQQGASITIAGKLPLLVVSESTIEVSGPIDFTGATGSDDPGCDAPSSPNNQKYGPGGPGGSHGGIGGAGGAGSDSGGTSVAAVTPGAVNGLVDHLRSGCRGVTGGKGSNIAAGDGGLAGGGIELSAHDRVTVARMISADGTGGACGTAGASGAGGGGGGGTGGTILLEAPTIRLDSASLCAVGGAGGSGGAVGAAITTGGAGMGCTPGIPAASANAPLGGAGGDTGDGSSGASASMVGGGGGGGAAGRVTLHGAVVPTGLVTEKPGAVIF